jgi:hypothetical protein
MAMLESAQPMEVGSSRLPLARVALQAALAAPGVLGSDPGPRNLRVTDDRPAGVLTGVSATASADGRYTIDLCLIAGMVPLPELAETIRARVRAEAARRHLDQELGAVNVQFTRVLTDEDRRAVQAAVEEAEAAAPASGALAAEPTDAGLVREQAVARAAGAADPEAAAASEEVAATARMEAVGVAHQTAAAGTREAAPLGPAEAAALAAEQAALAAEQAALAARQAALAAGAPAVAVMKPADREPVTQR